VIVNGASYRCAGWWDKHFKDTKENIRADVVQSHGLVSDTMYGMMREMETLAQGTRCENFMWIADLSPTQQESRRMSEEQWDQMRKIVEKHRGLEGQPYFVIEQEKIDGRIHRHIVWSRIDIEHMRAIPDGRDARVCHAASREISHELGLERTPSPYDKDREGPRPKRAPERWEMYRGMKTGIDPRDIAAEVKELFHQSDSGKAFQAALEEHGYMLLKGDRRAFVILDSAGKEHSLARRLDGVTTKELNAFMRDVEREALPTVEKGKLLHQKRQVERLEADRETVRHEIQWEETLARAAVEKEKIESRFVAREDREKTPAGRQEKDQPRPDVADKAQTVPERIREAHALAENREQFAEALDQHGIAFGVVTPEESHRSHREAEFARAIGRKSRRYEAGEIVAVTEPRLEYLREGEWTALSRIHKLDPAEAENYLNTLGMDKSDLQGIDATQKQLDDRTEQRAADREEIRIQNAAGEDDEAPVAQDKDTFLRDVGSPIASITLRLMDSFVEMVVPTIKPKTRATEASKDKTEEGPPTTEVPTYLANLPEEHRPADVRRHEEENYRKDRERDR
jgi:hypothetical protein